MQSPLPVVSQHVLCGRQKHSIYLSSSLLQLTNKTISNSQTELENRLHQLTETLIQKQTMLEALGTEKSSLVFQLERLEQQLKNAQGGQSGGPTINMSGLEGPGRRGLEDSEHVWLLRGIDTGFWVVSSIC